MDSQLREWALALGGIGLAIVAALVGAAVVFRLNGDDDAQPTSRAIVAATSAADAAATGSARTRSATANAATREARTPVTPEIQATVSPQASEAPATETATPDPTATATPPPSPTPTGTATPSPRPSPTPTATPTQATTGLSQSSFSLPGEATPNNGGTIGPFCCRGRTVTVTTPDGAVVGYAYWFQWSGQAYDEFRSGIGTDSFYPNIRVLVAEVGGSSTSIDFAAAELSAGASRSIATGRLTFVVTIGSAEQRSYGGGTYVWGSSLTATLGVSLQ